MAILSSINRDTIILFAACILAIAMLILYVPKNRLREAQMVFLFKQSLTWLSGIIVAEFRLIEYPVRFFGYAVKTSLTFEFAFYPATCVLFILNYPEEKSKIRQFFHYFAYCTVITIIEVICEKYTNIIKYIHWNWFITWVTLLITFYLARLNYVWFFKKKKEKA